MGLDVVFLVIDIVKLVGIAAPVGLAFAIETVAVHQLDFIECLRAAETPAAGQTEQRQSEKSTRYHGLSPWIKSQKV